jgi:regulatory protein
MNDERGGDSDRVAPIIPLFGGVDRGASTEPSAETPSDPSHDAQRAVDVVPRRTGDAGLWRSTWDEPVPRSVRSDQSEVGSPSERHPARGAARKSEATRAPRLRALNDPSRSQADGAADDTRPSHEELRATAEEALVRKLRSRSLSVSEARLVLKGLGVDAPTVDEIVDEFSRRGYLDDAVLAEQLVTSGVARKGQGRVALARALAQRGIPRDVIDTALDELPDDDAERALEFARTKARSMARLDPDAALRRLIGQLARRGYNGGIAMTAAKTALREASFGGATSGVRFVDSD